MKNGIRSFNLALVFAILFGMVAAECLCATLGFGQKYIKGGIIGGLSLQERINLVPGDKTLVSLGAKQGVIKGDILRIATPEDVSFIDPVGRCAVLRAGEDSSICEIIKGKKEIGRDYVVFAAPLQYDNPALYPYIYKLLFNVVDPYEPSKSVKVCIGGIYNSSNEITRFSEEMGREMKNLFTQKKRVTLRDDDVKRNFVFYPDSSEQDRDSLKELMQITGIDVFVATRYGIADGLVRGVFSLYDRKFGDKQIGFEAPLVGRDIAALSEVIRPFEPVVRRVKTSCTVSYRALNHRVVRDSRHEAIDGESNGNELTRLALEKSGFNIVGATSLKLTTGETTTNFDSAGPKEISLLEGMNRLVASFRRGYYRNESLVLTSDKEEKTEIMVFIKNAGKLYIDVTADPAMGGKPVFTVYRKTDKERLLLRPIKLESGETGINVFKD